MPKHHTFLDLAVVNAPYMDRIAAELERVARSGRYVGGADCSRFEQELARVTGTDFAVGTANGLDALRLIFRAYIELGRMAPGDEVIVPANTYIASVLGAADCGLRVVPVEPRVDTMNLDTSLVEQAVTPRTRAVMTVHLYGRACYDSTLAEVARRHNLIVVEDNAQAIGAEVTVGCGESLQRRRTGALGHAAAFSFYPTKNIGALGDAGAVTTSDPELAAAVRALANYGSDRQYHNIYAGYNSRLDPMQAAVLSVKLPHLDSENAMRRTVAGVYDRMIDNPLVTKPLYDDGALSSVWHQYVVRVDDRDGFRRYLADRGVDTAVHYPVPLYRQPCYDGRLWHGTPLPVTDSICRTVVSLPVSRCTSADDAAEIASIINDYKI